MKHLKKRASFLEKLASFLHTVVNEKASSLWKLARFLVKWSPAGRKLMFVAVYCLATVWLDETSKWRHIRIQIASFINIWDRLIWRDRQNWRLHPTDYCPQRLSPTVIAVFWCPPWRQAISNLHWRDYIFSPESYCTTPGAWHWYKLLIKQWSW